MTTPNDQLVAALAAAENRAEVARRAGLPHRSAVTKIISGERRITLAEAPALAAAVGLEFPPLRRRRAAQRPKKPA